MTRSADFIILLTRGSRSLESEIYSNNDFEINLNRIEPQITYRVGNNFRMNLDYKYEKKQNLLGGEVALINDLKLGITYSQKSKSRIMAELKYASVSYDGTPNTALELNMLDGLKNGDNLLWSIDYSKRIRKNIDVSFSYEGRKTGENRIVNVGRAQVKSSF